MSRNVNSHNAFSLIFSIFQKNPGFGTSDGTFQNKRYFRCAPNSAVFVGLDKLAPFEDDNSELKNASKSPKRDDHGQVNFKSRLDAVLPSLFKGKSDLKFPQPRHFDALKIDQRVVTFRDKGAPLRGTVRFTGDVEDSSGHVQSVVGLELVGIIQKVMDSLLYCFFFPKIIQKIFMPPLKVILKFPEEGAVRTRNFHSIRGLTSN